ncbi:hypothetical protein MMC06_005601 [Schaereria dolodes]|nr:hypothetical protein [Schaereria dolodes]
MSSSVFVRFKSQKEPSRVTFDGTGISVFDLKREIITMNRLGDGTDFELVISDDNQEDYDDDTAIIPRSTTVIAKRLPAAKPGRGGAARYVSGKMPTTAKISFHHKESVKPQSKVSYGDLQSEEERIQAMFKLGADQWEEQQQQMASVTPVHRGGSMKGKPINVPDRAPPPGYICYRCGEKGHWIQVCPTNDDPNFDGRPRVKRTTGIPRSFLKSVEKPSALTNTDGTMDESKYPSGVMVNAEGEWVIAEPDKAAWEQYQAKAKVSAAAQEAAARGSKELQDRGLECSIDKHLFVEPTKTPCCKMTYCNECITTALLDNDLQCPGCSTNGILIDDLIPDIDMVAKIRDYKEEQKEINTSKTPTIKHEDTPEVTGSRSRSISPEAAVEGISKKRPAEAELENDRLPPSSRGPLKSSTSLPPVDRSQQAGTVQPSSMPFDMSLFTNGNIMPLQGMSMGMPTSMGPILGMAPNVINPMMMSPGSFTARNSINWHGIGGLNGTYGGGHYMAAMMPISGYPQANRQMAMENGFLGMNGAGPNTQGMGSFANQQRTTFSAPRINEEDSAYFRKPVNPHRHQGRRNINRPTDYREI